MGSTSLSVVPHTSRCSPACKTFLACEEVCISRSAPGSCEQRPHQAKREEIPETRNLLQDKRRISYSGPKEFPPRILKYSQRVWRSACGSDECLADLRRECDD